MNLLQTLAHLVHHGQPQQHPQAQAPHPLAQQLAQHPYAQYMNPDGSGGGFGPNNPSAGHQGVNVQPQHSPSNLGVPYGSQPQGYSDQPQTTGGNYNPGYTPLQNSGFGPSVQQPAQTYWQNTDGQRRNMYNPQSEDNGYYYL